MRLIDADELINILEWNKGNEKDSLVSINSLVELISERPTAYDVDNVIKEIESCFNATEGKGRRLAYHRAITIVKGGINGLN